jgi:hypothetical protein
MGRSGSSVACLSGPAPGITVSIEALITADGMAADGMVHTLSLILAMATMAEPFPPIVAQSPTPSLAADSGAVLALSAVADVANRLEGCLN